MCVMLGIRGGQRMNDVMRKIARRITAVPSACPMITGHGTAIKENISLNYLLDLIRWFRPTWTSVGSRIAELDRVFPIEMHHIAMHVSVLAARKSARIFALPSHLSPPLIASPGSTCTPCKTTIQPAIRRRSRSFSGNPMHAKPERIGTSPRFSIYMIESACPFIAFSDVLLLYSGQPWH